MMDEEDKKRIAGQLRKPSGEAGQRIGEKMFESNGSMIRKTIDLLPLEKGAFVLEIGYGNGAHLNYLLEKGEDIHYRGVDISELMQKEAIRNNQKEVEAGTVEFLLGDGIHLPLESELADFLFTVNTIYFWEDYPEVFREIMRVLKPGATVCIALASRRFMEKLPFSPYGFRLFHPEEVHKLLDEAGFARIQLFIEKEAVSGFLPDIKERELILALGQKPAVGRME